MILIAGCSNAVDPQQTASDQITTDTSPLDVGGGVVASVPDRVPDHISLLQTPSNTRKSGDEPTQIVTAITTIPQGSQDSQNTFCGEMVTCGDLPASSGMVAVPSTRCSQITNLVVRHDPRAIQCFRNAYTGSTTTTWTAEYTKLLCAKGIGSPASCAKVGATLQPVQHT